MASGKPTNGNMPANDQTDGDGGKDAQVEEEKWDEEELEKAMGTLKELHIKVNRSEFPTEALLTGTFSYEICALQCREY